MIIKKISLIVFSFALMLNLSAVGKNIRIFLVGDSIVATYSPGRYPQTGWGQLLSRIFKKNVQVINCAVGGKSSKSFRTEGNWAKVLTQLRPKDYLFIELGNNDQYPLIINRYSDPDTTYQENLKSYITEARKVGAIPVLVTMPVRGWGFSRNGSHKCSHVQRQKNIPVGVKKTKTTYPNAMRKVAKELQVPLIDLYRQSLNYLKNKPYNVIKTYYLSVPAGKYPAYPKGKNDLAHLSFKGAAKLNEFIAVELKKLDLPLKNSLKRPAARAKALQDSYGIAKQLNLSSDNIVAKYDLSQANYSAWHKSNSPEITITTAKNSKGQPILILKFAIDHKGGNARYPKAWPRAKYLFKDNNVDVNAFDYIIFNVKVKSTRQAPLGSIMSVSLSSNENCKAEYIFDLGKESGQWQFIVIPVPELLATGNGAPDKFKSLKLMQLVISEKNYPDKTKLELKIKDLAFIKCKN